MAQGQTTTNWPNGIDVSDGTNGGVWANGTQVIDADGTLLTQPDITVASVTTGIGLALDDNTALTTGQLVKIASSATAIATTGRLLSVVHSGATGTSAVLSEFSSAATDETTLVKITASAALALGTALNVSVAAMTTGTGIKSTDNTALTTGILCSLASAATAITGAGRLLRVDHTGATGTSAILSEFASAATDETVIVKITASAALAAGVALQISGASVTTGTLVSCADANALTSGAMISLTSNSADATARSLVYVKNDHASAVAATCLELVNDAPLGAIKTTVAATSTNFFKVGVFNGVTLWVGNGNTGNAALSGTAGDILFNGGTNKPEYCTGTTNWTALA